MRLEEASAIATPLVRSGVQLIREVSPSDGHPPRKGISNNDGFDAHACPAKLNAVPFQGVTRALSEAFIIPTSGELHPAAKQCRRRDYAVIASPAGERFADVGKSPDVGRFGPQRRKTRIEARRAALTFFRSIVSEWGLAALRSRSKPFEAASRGLMRRVPERSATKSSPERL